MARAKSRDIARHPSETDERMMVRLLAFALHADEALEFGRGLSAEDEPDLWQRDLTGAIERASSDSARPVRSACAERPLQAMRSSRTGTTRGSQP